ncbi:MAG: helix-turn-helix transcriptional regulator [Beutenbergiaceae bacterium]
MENIRPGYGPIPTVDGSDLTTAQWAVLTVIADCGPDIALADIADAMSLHSNTIRGHLDALTQQGLVTRRQAPAVGRGRPAHLYTAAASPQRTRHPHAELAASLASELASISPDPSATARAAGNRWGSQLANELKPESPPQVPARERLIPLLDTLGFAAEDDGDVIRLRQCPLLATARRHTEIVCGVHTGLVEGALDAMGGDGQVTLEPFAEPGCCRLRIS